MLKPVYEGLKAIIILRRSYRDLYASHEDREVLKVLVVLPLIKVCQKVSHLELCQLKCVYIGYLLSSLHDKVGIITRDLLRERVYKYLLWNQIFTYKSNHSFY